MKKIVIVPLSSGKITLNRREALSYWKPRVKKLLAKMPEALRDVMLKSLDKWADK